MSVFSVAALATDSSNSAASNVTDEANSSAESVALSNNNNITCLTCCNGLISNTSSPGIINESTEVPDPDLPVINDTDIDATKTVSAMSSCSYVWIKITDKYCKGYKVYVDGVYQFTEGEGGVPDGYCCFKVTPGYHTFKLTLNGKSVSKGWNCRCGVVYNWVSMNDMIPHWCEDGGSNDNPTDEYEVKFQGTVTSTTPSEYDCGFKDVYICEVKIEKVVFGDYFEKGDIVNIVYSQWRENAHACGTYDKVSVGDTVEVYGEMIPIYCVGTWITICGKSSYYLKKIDSKTLSINVWTDKSEYEIGETVTIHYQTNKKCTAKLTITKPDGGKVVYGPNEIPACTRSKSPTAGYPTGRRTVVFEAWAGDEYKKATCYFDVVEEELVCDVTFEGIVTDIYNKYDPHYYDANIKVTRVIDDPSGTLYVGKTVTVKRTNEDAYEDAVNVGDKVEVHAGYDTRYSFYAVGRWEDYIKKLPEEKKPDLIIQDIYWSPSNPKEGDTVTFTIKVKNQGSGSAGGFYVCYYVDGSYYARDYVSSLSAGSTTTTSFTWTADCGSHSIKAVAGCYSDVAESNEGNNARTENINIVCKPDLVVQDISWSPSNPKKDNMVSINVKTKNQGSVSAGGFYVCYYVDGSYYARDYVSSLSAGSTTTTSFTWTAKCGSHSIKAVADCYDAITESNEGNNARTEYINIVCKPDLVIQDISWSPSNPKQGDTVTINVKTKNQGSVSAGGFYVCYYVDGSYYARDYVSSLSAGSTTTTSFTWTAKCGSHSIKAVADCYDAITESNEGNNARTEYINIVCKPDLVIQDISWSPSNPKQGDTVTINVKTKNQGSGSAGGFYVCYYVDGSYYARDYVSSLSAGSTTTTSFSWTADCGSHSIKAVADCYDAITESNEGNNARTENINIVCKPDLVVQDISWSPSNPKEGDTVTFTVKVKNQGSWSAGSSTVKYYIDGSYVTSDPVPGLSAGSTSTQTFTWKANKCGNVKVKAVADATNAVAESNEGNNERTETMSVTCLFYIRPACQDVNGNHLDDVSYEFVDYPSYKGTCDYNEYIKAPGFGTYKVKFTKGDLEATFTLESHSKTFAGTVVTLKALASWTFMVYMDADNNLGGKSGPGFSDLNEMEMVGYTPKVNIIVLNDNGFNRGYVKIKTDNDPSIIISSVVKSMNEVNMGSPKALSDFIKWTKGHYPAKRYGIVLWDHGSGWRGCCNDTSERDKLTLMDLKDALEEAGLKFNLIGFDACAMGMTEVAYQIKDYANIVVASEESEGSFDTDPQWSIGMWPYNRILKKLKDNPGMTEEKLGEIIVTEYTASWTNGKNSPEEFDPLDDQRVTMAAINAKNIAKLKDAINEFSEKLMNYWGTYHEEIVSAHANSESYGGNKYGDEYFDLYYFAQKLSESNVPNELKNSAIDVMRAIDSAVIYKDNGPKHPNSHGLSIYFPLRNSKDGYDCNYDQLDFAKDTKWDDWLKIYLKEEKEPDLVVQDIWWSPSNPKEGDTVTFTVKVKNQGSWSAGTSTVKYYIDGSYVGSDTVPSLSVSSTSTQTFTWTANKCGNVKVKAIADATNAVDESNEGNNRRVETVHIECPPKEKPDLTIQSISVSPPNPKLGDNVEFAVTVKNIGKETAGKSHVFVYAINWDAGKVLFKINDACPSLKPGEVYTYHKSVKIEDCGEYDLMAWADAQNEVNETNEKNNYKDA
ncbi:MAG: clostripain-related cysteine peptidase, partial [Methanophagales archaeon]|nr:clostripain-related cysteine peptidase [Methanophagales archaeon]